MKELVEIGNNNNNKNKNNKDYLTNLPLELLKKEIFAHLSLENLLNLKESSKFFNRHLNDIVKKEFNKLLKKVKIIQGDFGTTFILNSEGQFWAYGHHFLGQLGLGKDYKPVLNPVPLSFSEPVMHVAAAQQHTFFQLKSGKVLSCGKNNTGQLGWGGHAFYYQPQELSNYPSNLKDIVAGTYRTYFLTKEGKLFGCGKFDSSYTTSKYPLFYFDLPFPIKQVVARNENTFLLLENGDVLGSSDSRIVCQLSCLEELINTNGKFEKLPIKDVKQIILGDQHVLFLRENGIWGCGNNSFGQLGLGSDIVRIENEIVKLPINQPIKKVFAGTNYTFFLLENGEIWACGNNHFGELGVNHKNAVYKPEKLPVEPHFIIGISAGGAGSTIFLGKNGKVYGCDLDCSGSVGLGRVWEVGSTITELSAITECLGLHQFYKRMENKTLKKIAQEKNTSEDQNSNSKQYQFNLWLALMECLGLNKLLFKRMKNETAKNIDQKKETSEDQNNNSKHSM